MFSDSAVILKQKTNSEAIAKKTRQIRKGQKIGQKQQTTLQTDLYMSRF